jgi:hypothetical protein
VPRWRKRAPPESTTLTQDLHRQLIAQIASQESIAVAVTLLIPLSRQAAVHLDTSVLLAPQFPIQSLQSKVPMRLLASTSPPAESRPTTPLWLKPAALLALRAISVRRQASQHHLETVAKVATALRVKALRPSASLVTTTMV